MARRDTLLHALVLTAFVGLAYGPFLDVPLLFDDIPNIVLNPGVHLRSWADLPEVLGAAFAAGRPVALLSLALNYLAGGLDPHGYHLVNIAIHLAAAMVLYALLRALLVEIGRTAQAPAIAFWGTALWALNPVQTQAVTYTVQRASSLAALFYLAGLLVGALWLAGRLRTVPACLLFGLCLLLAAGSKQHAVTLPIAALLMAQVIYRRGVPAGVWLGVSILVVGAGLAYLGGLPAWGSPLPGRAFSAWERLLTEPRVLWHYAGLYLVPLVGRLHLDYEVLISRGPFEPWTTLPAIAAWLLAAILAWRARAGRPLVAFAVLFFLLASSVEASFLNLELAFIHRIYLPSAFVAAAVLAWLPPGSLGRTTPLWIVVLGLLTYATMARNEEWRTGAGFWAEERARGASRDRSVTYQGFALLQAGRYQEAVTLLRAAIPAAREAERVHMRVQLGMAYFFLGRYPQAKAVFEDLIREGFSGVYPMFYLGQIAVLEGDAEAGLDYAGRLERLTNAPYLGEVLRALSERRSGRKGEAVRRLRATLAGLDPGNDLATALVRVHLAEALIDLGDYPGAARLWTDLVREDPGNWYAWRRLYQMQRAAGDDANAEAIRRFLRSKGVALDDESPGASSRTR